MEKSEKQTPWKVIYTASRQEKKVAALLDRLGIIYYLPLVKKLRIWSDRKKWVEMPLFNGYVFVKPEPNMRDKVLEIPGVVKYLKHNGADAQVENEEIKLIDELINNGYNIENYNNELFEKGDEVLINQGPLNGRIATIIKNIDRTTYVLVAFETISQVIKIKVDRRIINKNKK
jgi:transcription antitermination factor NusG